MKVSKYIILPIICLILLYTVSACDSDSGKGKSHGGLKESNHNVQIKHKEDSSHKGSSKVTLGGLLSHTAIKTSTSSSKNTKHDDDSSSSKSGKITKITTVKPAPAPVPAPKPAPAPTTTVYQEVKNYQKDTEAMLAFNFLKKSFGNAFSTCKILKVSRQILNGVNYQFLIQFKYTTSIQLKYLITLVYSTSKIFSVSKTQFVQLPKFEKNKCRHFAKVKDIPFYTNIASLLYLNLAEKYKKYTEIVDGDVSQPYFVLTCKNKEGANIKVTLIYDLLKAALNIISVEQIAAPKPVVVIPQPTPIPKPTPTPVTPVVTTPTKPVQPVKPIQPTVPVVTQPVVEPKPVVTVPTTPVKPTPTPVQPTQPIIVTQPTPSAPSIPKPTGPIYEISLNNTWISQLQSVSDPALVPFLTSSYAEELNQQKIEAIITFIISRLSITQAFTVVLINQIRYGVRIVIAMKSDQKLFEAVVTYTYKNGDISTAERQLLSWRQIDSISDVDPDVFTKYYNLPTDSVAEQLKGLITRAFQTQQTISKFKKIVKVEKRASFDGVYYKVILDTLNGYRYQIILYWIPETDYLEIIKYEFVSNGYDATLEKRFVNVPANDQCFDAAKKVLIGSFSGLLADSSIDFMALYETPEIKYYRFVFSTKSGRYEGIFAVNIVSLAVIIIRWEKLEDGYVFQNIQNLQNDAYFNQLTSFSRIYLSKKLNLDLTPDLLQYKIVPGYCKYFRFMYNQPFPFILTLDSRDNDGSIATRGLQRVQIIPSNIYYNDRLFAGFSSLNIQSIKYDTLYQYFFNVLVAANKGITQSNHEIVAAFKRAVPIGMYYKIIYKVTITSKLWLVTFFNDYGTGEYKLVSVEQYEPQIEQGDYRWKCSSYNSNTGVCNTCESNQFLLTAGRCYLRSTGCSIQMASTCFVCQAGYLLFGGKCDRSPSSAISEVSVQHTNVQVVNENVVTSTGPHVITYEYSYGGDICLRYNGAVCVLCAYRFYLNNGACVKVQDECEQYDNVTGICTKCYSNYYLCQTKQCLPLKPECASGNSLGECTSCYNDYTLTNGNCIKNSYISAGYTAYKPVVVTTTKPVVTTTTYYTTVPVFN